MTCGIYQIKNEVNGKRYIGRSLAIKRRWGVHKSELRRGIHKNDHLQNSWDKYGEESFEFEIIHEIEDEEGRIEKEQEYFDAYLSANIWSQLYNIEKDASEGGPSLEGENHPNYGEELPKEVREAIAEANKGKEKSEEHKKAIAEAMKGEDHPMYGETHSEEACKEISKSLEGREFSEAHKKALSEATEGKEGGENVNSKLTESQVKEIRRRYEEGNTTYRKLAEEYPVDHRTTIGRIIRGETWTHVEGPIKGRDYE